jgi:hypothetical protein
MVVAARSKSGLEARVLWNFFWEKGCVGQRVFIDEFSWPRGQEIWSKSTKQIWSDTGEQTRVLSGLWLELRDDMRAPVVRKEKNKRRMKRGSAAAWPGRSRRGRFGRFGRAHVHVWAGLGRPIFFAFFSKSFSFFLFSDFFSRKSFRALIWMKQVSVNL